MKLKNTRHNWIYSVFTAEYTNSLKIPKHFLFFSVLLLLFLSLLFSLSFRFSRIFLWIKIHSNFHVSFIYGERKVRKFFTKFARNKTIELEVPIDCPSVKLSGCCFDEFIIATNDSKFYNRKDFDWKVWNVMNCVVQTHLRSCVIVVILL